MDSTSGSASSSSGDLKQRLKELLQRKSIVWGKVKLASGQESDYYFDCKLTTLDPEGAFLTAHAVLDLLAEHGIKADAIGGPPIGAHPIVAAVAVVSHLRAKEGNGRPLPAFLIRKQAKAHGSQERIEGVLQPGMRVAMVDDVLTTGGSVMQAIVEVEKRGAQVVSVICIVDRLEGAREVFSRYAYRPIFTIRDFGIEPPTS